MLEWGAVGLLGIMVGAWAYLSRARDNEPKQKTIVISGAVVVKEHSVVRMVPVHLVVRSEKEAVGAIWSAIQHGVSPDSDEATVQRFISSMTGEKDD